MNHSARNLQVLKACENSNSTTTRRCGMAYLRLEKAEALDDTIEREVRINFREDDENDDLEEEVLMF